MRMSDSIAELATALVAVQAELPTPIKDKTAQGTQFSYTYVSLDTVMPDALAILGKHKLALTQTPGTAEDGTCNLSTTLLHTSGEWLTDTQPLLLTKQDAQGQGSAITYARRYGLMSILGIVADDDDDGATASKKPATRRKAAAPKAAAKTTAAKPAANGSQNTGPATPQQTAIIMRLLGDMHGEDERAQCEEVAKINPHAVNDAGTSLALSTLTQDEGGQLIMGLQAAKQTQPA